ncbi:hypothetical protein BJX65DRAFT_312029 [Aspergillus insuetus]
MAYNTTACVAAAIILYVLSCISLVLRFYTRIAILRNFAADDYLATIATVTNSVLAISYTLGVLRCGLGSGTPRDASQPGLKVIVIGELAYFITTYVTKLSFVFTLFRIVMKRSQIAILYALMAAGLVVTVFAWFWVLFFCSPLSITLTVHGAWVLLADITLGLVVPVLILWGCRMQWKVKASVYLLLGVGLVPSIATIIRLTYLPHHRVTEPLIAHHPLLFWSVVESSITIICTAAVAIKPLIVRLGGSSASCSGANADHSPYSTYHSSRRRRGGGGTARRSARAHSGLAGKGHALEAGSDEWVMMEAVEAKAELETETDTQSAGHTNGTPLGDEDMAWQENISSTIHTQMRADGDP